MKKIFLLLSFILFTFGISFGLNYSPVFLSNTKSFWYKTSGDNIVKDINAIGPKRDFQIQIFTPQLSGSTNNMDPTWSKPKVYIKGNDLNKRRSYISKQNTPINEYLVELWNGYDSSNGPKNTPLYFYNTNLANAINNIYTTYGLYYSKFFINKEHLKFKSNSDFYSGVDNNVVLGNYYMTYNNGNINYNPAFGNIYLPFLIDNNSVTLSGFQENFYNHSTNKLLTPNLGYSANDKTAVWIKQDINKWAYSVLPGGPLTVIAKNYGTDNYYVDLLRGLFNNAITNIGSKKVIAYATDDETQFKKLASYILGVKENNLTVDTSKRKIKINTTNYSGYNANTDSILSFKDIKPLYFVTASSTSSSTNPQSLSMQIYNNNSENNLINVGYNLIGNASIVGMPNRGIMDLVGLKNNQLAYSRPAATITGSMYVLSYPSVFSNKAFADNCSTSVNNALTNNENYGKCTIDMYGKYGNKFKIGTKEYRYLQIPFYFHKETYGGADSNFDNQLLAYLKFGQIDTNQLSGVILSGDTDTVSIKFKNFQVKVIPGLKNENKDNISYMIKNNIYTKKSLIKGVTIINDYGTDTKGKDTSLYGYPMFMRGSDSKVINPIDELFDNNDKYKTSTAIDFAVNFNSDFFADNLLNNKNVRHSIPLFIDKNNSSYIVNEQQGLNISNNDFFTNILGTSVLGETKKLNTTGNSIIYKNIKNSYNELLSGDINDIKNNIGWTNAFLVSEDQYGFFTDNYLKSEYIINKYTNGNNLAYKQLFYPGKLNVSSYIGNNKDHIYNITTQLLNFINTHLHLNIMSENGYSGKVGGISTPLQVFSKLMYKYNNLENFTFFDYFKISSFDGILDKIYNNLKEGNNVNYYIGWFEHDSDGNTDQSKMGYYFLDNTSKIYPLLTTIHGGLENKIGNKSLVEYTGKVDTFKASNGNAVLETLGGLGNGVSSDNGNNHYVDFNTYNPINTNKIIRTNEEIKLLINNISKFNSSSNQDPTKLVKNTFSSIFNLGVAKFISSYTGDDPTTPLKITNNLTVNFLKTTADKKTLNIKQNISAYLNGKTFSNNKLHVKSDKYPILKFNNNQEITDFLNSLSDNINTLNNNYINELRKINSDCIDNTEYKSCVATDTNANIFSDKVSDTEKTISNDILNKAIDTGNYLGSFSNCEFKRYSVSATNITIEKMMKYGSDDTDYLVYPFQYGLLPFNNDKFLVCDTSDNKKALIPADFLVNLTDGSTTLFIPKTSDLGTFVSNEISNVLPNNSFSDTQTKDEYHKVLMDYIKDKLLWGFQKKDYNDSNSAKNLFFVKYDNAAGNGLYYTLYTNLYGINTKHVDKNDNENNIKLSDYINTSYYGEDKKTEKDNIDMNNITFISTVSMLDNPFNYTKSILTLTGFYDYNFVEKFNTDDTNYFFKNYTTGNFYNDVNADGNKIITKGLYKIGKNLKEQLLKNNIKAKQVNLFYLDKKYLSDKGIVLPAINSASETKGIILVALNLNEELGKRTILIPYALIDAGIKDRYKKDGTKFQNLKIKFIALKQFYRILSLDNPILQFNTSGTNKATNPECSTEHICIIDGNDIDNSTYPTLLTNYFNQKAFQDHSFDIKNTTSNINNGTVSIGIPEYGNYIYQVDNINGLRTSNISTFRNYSGQPNTLSNYQDDIFFNNVITKLPGSINFDILKIKPTYDNITLDKKAIPLYDYNNILYTKDLLSGSIDTKKKITKDDYNNTFSGNANNVSAIKVKKDDGTIVNFPIYYTIDNSMFNSVLDGNNNYKDYYTNFITGGNTALRTIGNDDNLFKDNLDNLLGLETTDNQNTNEIINNNIGRIYGHSYYNTWAVKTGDLTTAPKCDLHVFYYYEKNPDNEDSSILNGTYIDNTNTVIIDGTNYDGIIENSSETPKDDTHTTHINTFIMYNSGDNECDTIKIQNLLISTHKGLEGTGEVRKVGDVIWKKRNIDKGVVSLTGLNIEIKKGEYKKVQVKIKEDTTTNPFKTGSDLGFKAGYTYDSSKDTQTSKKLNIRYKYKPREGNLMCSLVKCKIVPISSSLNANEVNEPLKYEVKCSNNLNNGKDIKNIDYTLSYNNKIFVPEKGFTQGQQISGNVSGLKKGQTIMGFGSNDQYTKIDTKLLYKNILYSTDLGNNAETQVGLKYNAILEDGTKVNNCSGGALTLQVGVGMDNPNATASKDFTRCYIADTSDDYSTKNIDLSSFINNDTSSNAMIKEGQLYMKFYKIENDENSVKAYDYYGINGNCSEAGTNAYGSDSNICNQIAEYNDIHYQGVVSLPNYITLKASDYINKLKNQKIKIKGITEDIGHLLNGYSVKIDYNHGTWNASTKECDNFTHTIYTYQNNKDTSTYGGNKTGLTTKNSVSAHNCVINTTITTDLYLNSELYGLDETNSNKPPKKYDDKNYSIKNTSEYNNHKAGYVISMLKDKESAKNLFANNPYAFFSDTLGKDATKHYTDNSSKPFVELWMPITINKAEFTNSTNLTNNLNGKQVASADPITCSSNLDFDKEIYNWVDTSELQQEYPIYTERHRASCGRHCTYCKATNYPGVVNGRINLNGYGYNYFGKYDENLHNSGGDCSDSYYILRSSQNIPGEGQSNSVNAAGGNVVLPGIKTYQIVLKHYQTIPKNDKKSQYSFYPSLVTKGWTQFVNDAYNINNTSSANYDFMNSSNTNKEVFGTSIGTNNNITSTKNIEYGKNYILPLNRCYNIVDNKLINNTDDGNYGNGTDGTSQVDERGYCKNGQRPLFYDLLYNQDYKQVYMTENNFTEINNNGTLSFSGDKFVVDIYDNRGAYGQKGTIYIGANNSDNLKIKDIGGIFLTKDIKDLSDQTLTGYITTNIIKDGNDKINKDGSITANNLTLFINGDLVISKNVTNIQANLIVKGNVIIENSNMPLTIQGYTYIEGKLINKRKQVAVAELDKLTGKYTPSVRVISDPIFELLDLPFKKKNIYTTNK